MSPKFQKVLIITLCWTILQIVTYINNYYLIQDLVSMDRLQGYLEFGPDFLGNIIIGVLGGLMGGYFLVYRLNSGYSQRTFLSGIITSGLYFILLYLGGAVVILFMMTFVYFGITEGISVALERSWNNLVLNIYTPSFFVGMVIWAVVVSATQFMLQVNDKFGPGVLWKFLTGKYHSPRNEERIFMFLDLRGSTTIAEQIGNPQFFSLLKALYQDITRPVIQSVGEIYQYIGDEVVITWPVQNGLRNSNCIMCFFRIAAALKTLEGRYLEKYGVIPTIKAGLHIGEATVGEIGVIKKDIVFSGDVLNTTSRIQGECNKYGVDLLVSGDLLGRLPDTKGLIIASIGEIGLRGKAEEVELFSVTSAAAQIHSSPLRA